MCILLLQHCMDTPANISTEIKKYVLTEVNYNNGVKYQYIFKLPACYLLTEFKLHSDIIPITVLYTYNGLLAAQGEQNSLGRWNFGIKIPGLYFSESEIIIRTIERLSDDVFITIHGLSVFILEQGLNLSLFSDISMKLVQTDEEGKFKLALGEYKSDNPTALDTETSIKEVTFSDSDGFFNSGPIINDPKYKIEQITKLE